jgi:hypothetical protein
MIEPIAAGTFLAKQLGPPLASKVAQWAKGSEAHQLAKVLKPRFPAAQGLLTQPAALRELWFYAETGEFRREETVLAIRPLTKSDEEAEALAEAIRTTQWRVMRDARQQHFEFDRLAAEFRDNQEAGEDRILARIEDAIAKFARALPAARQLPAQTSPFVDRKTEIAAGERLLTQPAASQAAVVLSCSGMAGIGKSAFVLELAHRHADRFPGGVLYVEMRSPDGRTRSPGDVAARLLRDLGVAPVSIPRDPQERLAMLRSTLVETPVMLVLDNASDEDQVRELIPADSTSTVLITSSAPLSLGAAQPIDLAELGDDDAVALLATIIGKRVVEEPEAAAAIAKRCVGLPFALVVVAGRARRHPNRPLAEFARATSAGIDEIAALDDPSGSLRAMFASAIDAANETARRLLLLLAALDVTEIDPELVTALVQIDAASAARLLEELGDKRLLIEIEGGHWKFHEILRAVAASIARGELDDDQIASAQKRRVAWLVSAAKEHVRDLEGEV